MIPFVKSSKIKLMFNERLWLSFRERGKAIKNKLFIHVVSRMSVVKKETTGSKWSHLC